MVDTGGTQEQHDPGGNRFTSKENTYAGRLKTNVSYNERLKRNILEIVVEKTEKEAEIIINEASVERVLKSIGMDILSQVEGYQIQYNGRTSII